MRSRSLNIFYLLFLLMCTITFLSADEADVFFEADHVQEIGLYFDDPNWYNTLYQGHANDPDDPYFPARFEYGDIIIDPIGVRFKGNSSFSIQGQKKSIKIDFDQYDEDNNSLSFLGLKKLNLNNGFKDPTFLRSKLFFEFTSKFLPAVRVIHTKIYINDQYWGLYSAVEQVDKNFIQDRFGSAEDGNLFKGQASEDAGPQNDFGSDLTWLGTETANYMERYQLKTNEAANDYSDLIEFIDILNNTQPGDLPQLLEPILDVEDCLTALALNCLFVNLDAYNGSAHNYYLYDRDDTGQITHLHWDTNEAFGKFLYGMPPGQNALLMDPFWLPELPPNQPAAERPFMEKLWAVDKYHRFYLRAMARMLRKGFDAATMEVRITELADIIRDAVYADTQKQFSNDDFETNLTNNIEEIDNLGHISITYGLLNFVQSRVNYMNVKLNEFAEPIDLQVNEIMSQNTSTITDEAGDFDPWVEIYNLGPGLINTSEIYLTDDPDVLDKWTLPDNDLDDGLFVILWLDGEAEEGGNHASFLLDPDGGELILSYQSQSSIKIIQNITYPAITTDISWGRKNEQSDQWEYNGEPTPSAPNIAAPLPVSYNISINELMASNDSTISDPAGEYDDWLELYNSSDSGIFLARYYLSDEPDNLVKYQIPDTSIAANDFLLIWADDDITQTGLHAGFKLSASGEPLFLSGPDTSVIDSIFFEEQTTDVSFGRTQNGSAEWQFFSNPTPGNSNNSSALTADSQFPKKFSISPPYPNPFNMMTKIKYTLPNHARVILNIYDLKGRMIKTIINEYQIPGSYIGRWDGTNDSQKTVGSGIYLYQFVIKNYIYSGKMILLK